jgi:hypothetical protein
MIFNSFQLQTLTSSSSLKKETNLWERELKITIQKITFKPGQTRRMYQFAIFE